MYTCSLAIWGTSHYHINCLSMTFFPKRKLITRDQSVAVLMDLYQTSVRCSYGQQVYCLMCQSESDCLFKCTVRKNVRVPGGLWSPNKTLVSKESAQVHNTRKDHLKPCNVCKFRVIFVGSFLGVGLSHKLNYTKCIQLLEKDGCE